MKKHIDFTAGFSASLHCTSRVWRVKLGSCRLLQMQSTHVHLTPPCSCRTMACTYRNSGVAEQSTDETLTAAHAYDFVPLRSLFCTSRLKKKTAVRFRALCVLGCWNLCCVCRLFLVATYILQGYLLGPATPSRVWASFIVFPSQLNCLSFLISLLNLPLGF